MACFTPLLPRLVGLGFLIAIAPGLATAEEGAVAIKREDCARLVKHVPAPDGQGRPVVPADLDAGYGIALPETIRIPITVLLQDRFGIPANSDLYKGEAEIGLAEVSLDGERVTFNGQELGSLEAKALAAACQEILRVP